MKHKQLVLKAYKWLLSIGCSFAFKELKTFSHEQPDAIGWKYGKSILIECKTSRSDFISDRKKFFRQCSEMGVRVYRFFMSPAEVITKNDVLNFDSRWGLLWVINNDKIKRIHAPKGNVWSNWPSFENNKQQEILMLCSCLRRINQAVNLEEILNKFIK